MGASSDFDSTGALISMNPNNAAPIDREKACPALLRVFIKLGSHHSPTEFTLRGKEPTHDEVQIYTWPDATLRELTTLIKEVNDASRRRDARISFALVYPDKRGEPVVRQIGRVLSSKRTDEDAKSLRDHGFQCGDFLDVAVFVHH